MLIFCLIYIIINIQYKKWCLLIIPSCLLTWNYQVLQYWLINYCTVLISIYSIRICMYVLLYPNMYVFEYCMYCIRICMYWICTVFEYVLYSNTCMYCIRIPVCTVFIRISVCTVIRICIVFEYVHTCTTKLQLL